MPALYILAGPNGAGKSTAASLLLPDALYEHYTRFDADKIKRAKQREFYLKVRSYKEAGKLADEFVDEEFRRQCKVALKNNDHFVYEGHFTEDASWNLPRDFKKRGYIVRMIFLGLNSVAQSNQRVTTRAMQNGHTVHPADIEKNFYGNLEKLNKNYKLFNDLLIVDGSQPGLDPIAEYTQGRVFFQLNDREIPLWFKKYLPKIYKQGVADSKFLSK